jgi:hypothetical protein
VSQRERSVLMSGVVADVRVLFVFVSGETAALPRLVAVACPKSNQKTRLIIVLIFLVRSNLYFLCTCSYSALPGGRVRFAYLSNRRYMQYVTYNEVAMVLIKMPKHNLPLLIACSIKYVSIYSFIIRSQGTSVLQK